jgi:hypothetical protein
MKWEDHEWETAQRLLREGQSLQFIAATIGRPASGLKAKIRFHNMTAEERDRKNLRTRQSREGKSDPRLRSRRSLSLRVSGAADQPKLPASAIADREARYATPPRSLTALLCGDPLPGFSALERRA